MNRDTQDKTRDGQDERRHCREAWAAYRELRRLKIETDQKFQDVTLDASGGKIKEKLQAYQALKQATEVFQDKYIYRIYEFIKNLKGYYRKIEECLNKGKIDELKDIVIAEPGDPKSYLDQKGFERFIQEIFNHNIIKNLLKSGGNPNLILINSLIGKFLNCNQKKDQLIELGNFLKSLIDQPYFLPNLQGGRYQVRKTAAKAFINAEDIDILVTEECGDDSFDNISPRMIKIKKSGNDCFFNQQTGTVWVGESGINAFFKKEGGISIIKSIKDFCFLEMRNGIALALKKIIDNSSRTFCQKIEGGTVIAADFNLLKKCDEVGCDPDSPNQPLMLFNSPGLIFPKDNEIYYAEHDQDKFTFPYYYFDNKTGEYRKSAYKRLGSNASQFIGGSDVVYYPSKIIEAKNNYWETPRGESLIIFDDFVDIEKLNQRHNDFDNKIIVYQIKGELLKKLDLNGNNNVIILDERINLLIKDSNGNYKNDIRGVERKVEAIRRNIKINCNYPPNSPTPDLVLLRIPDPADSQMTTFEVLSP
jgi:hypothetical protein